MSYLRNYYDSKYFLLEDGGQIRTPIEPAPAQTILKLKIRLLPFLFALYVVAFVDRVNLGFAALTMNQDLRISIQQFGLAAGIFFWGYFLFEIPSNLLLHRIGARVWICRILLSWGVIAVLTGLVRSAQQLYLARFALGLAEAGYFPGIVLYLGYWFRQREKAQALALILMGMPIAGIIGAPISGFILDHVHWAHMSSWRWLLILEGAPAVVCAGLTYLVLPARPSEASFLTAEEKAKLIGELNMEEGMRQKVQPISVLQTLVHPRVWHLALIGFGHGFATYTVNFWLPQIMKAAVGESSSTHIGLLVAVPGLFGVPAMALVSRHSDRRRERRFHMAACVTVAGLALLLLGTSHSTVVTVILFAIVAMGAYSFLPVFFSVPGEFLCGFSAAAGIALVTSVANLGGFVGPYTVAFIQQKTGNAHSGLILAGVFYCLAACLAAALPRGKEPDSDQTGAPTLAYEAGN